jgi:type II secretory pathway pseudopilin PulG
MRTSRAGRRRNSAGFTYVAVLAAVVIVGIVAEAAHVATWRALRADREAELLFRGKSYQSAIASFHRANGVFPRTLDELVKDPRSAARRHIRALYRDPMAPDEKGEWRLVRAIDGGIAGVASASGEEPLKQANFPAEFERFTGARSYAEWIFEYVPAPPKGAPVAPRVQPKGQIFKKV